jgi:hypothetical protein
MELFSNIVCLLHVREILFLILTEEDRIGTNNTVFCVVTPCSSERARRFRGTYRLHLKGRRVSKQAYLTLTPAFVGFLLCLLFNPEDVGDMFLRNVWLSPNYKTDSCRCRNGLSSFIKIVDFLTNWVNVGFSRMDNLYGVRQFRFLYFPVRLVCLYP